MVIIPATIHTGNTRPTIPSPLASSSEMVWGTPPFHPLAVMLVRPRLTARGWKGGFEPGQREGAGGAFILKRIELEITIAETRKNNAFPRTSFHYKEIQSFFCSISIEKYLIKHTYIFFFD